MERRAHSLATGGDAFNQYKGQLRLAQLHVLLLLVWITRVHGLLITSRRTLAGELRTTLRRCVASAGYRIEQLWIQDDGSHKKRICARVGWKYEDAWAA